jgi:hypothetical protein
MRVDPTIKGITAGTTDDTLAALRLKHRKNHGKVRTKGELAPQTLATYHAEMIIPAIGEVRAGETNVPFLARLFADAEHGRKHGNYLPACTDAQPGNQGGARRDDQPRRRARSLGSQPHGQRLPIRP